MRSEWLGIKDYVEVMKMQERVLDRSALIRVMTAANSDVSETIFGLEHPLTITLGKRANPLNDIKVSVKVLREKRVAIHGTERGGEATLHNPGQLVIYPIINLRERGLKVRDYMCLIQDVTKRFLSDFGVQVKTPEGEPGLYTPEGKIAFFGIRIKNGMTSHGLAINITNDLQDFQFIRSCGKATETFSRLGDYVTPPSLEELFNNWCTYFRTGLELRRAPLDPRFDPPYVRSTL